MNFYEEIAQVHILQILDDFVLQFGEANSNALTEYWVSLRDQVKRLNIKYPSAHNTVPDILSDCIIIMENIREYSEKSFQLTVESLIKVGDVSITYNYFCMFWECIH